MKQFALSKWAGASVLAMSLVITSAALPGVAQTSPGSSPAGQDVQNNNAPNLDTTPFEETKGKADNYGWLGLIGLVGLLNLLRKPSHSTTAYREPNVTTRTSDRL